MDSKRKDRRTRTDERRKIRRIKRKRWNTTGDPVNVSLISGVSACRSEHFNHWHCGQVTVLPFHCLTPLVRNMLMRSAPILLVTRFFALLLRHRCSSTLSLPLPSPRGRPPLHLMRKDKKGRRDTCGLGKKRRMDRRDMLLNKETAKGCFSGME